MNDSKVLAFVFGLIPMTLIQYFYWNWLIDELKGRGGVYILFIVPVIATLVYCVYERYIIYSIISAAATFRDRIPLAILWILECIIGIMISQETVYNQLPHSGYEGSFIGLITIWCPFTGAIAIVSFLFCRIFLYREEES